MKVEIDVNGLEETLKALEECASDKELRRVNKKIVERAQPEVHDSMKKRIPTSADNSKSGRGLKGGAEQQTKARTCERQYPDREGQIQRNSSQWRGWLGVIRHQRILLHEICRVGNYAYTTKTVY